MSSSALPGQVVDTTSFASFFPCVEGVEIARDNILQTLETMLDGRNVRSVHIDGPPGAGKTILLSQFAKRYRSRTISLFLKRGSWFTFDADFLLRDLAAQIYWLLENRELQLDGDVNEPLMRRLVYSLRSYALRFGKPIILIVDGLGEIPIEQRDLKNVLLSRLPLGLDYIKLLTSAKKEDFDHLTGAKEWLVPMFSFEESLSFFGSTLTSEGVRTVNATCNGVPGYLASIKRLLETGNSEDSLLADLPKSAPDLFRMEWQAVDESSGTLIESLALLAHDSNVHTLEGLATLLATNVAVLRKDLNRLRFINLPLADDGSVEFVSEPFRQFVASKLATYKDSVNQRMIELLSTNENSADAITLLPAYLRQAGQNAKLLQYLSPERFAKLLDRSHQIRPVKQTVLLGLETAIEVGSHSEMLRFAIQSSALAEYAGFTVSRIEIAARMELQDLPSCIALAQAAVLLNDRLRLFAAIARIRCERKESIEPQFLTELQSLFDRAEWMEFSPESLTQLASDLVFVKPELATLALDKAHVHSPQGGARLDIALASASLLADSSSDQNVQANAEMFRAKIRNPRLLSLFTALSALMKDIDAEEVIRRVSQLGKPKEQIFLLRQWSLHARTNKDVAKVASYALDLAIRTTEYTPTATDFRELSEVFRRIEDQEDASELIQRLDAQRAAIESVGPTNDFIYLQLLLAMGDSLGDEDAAANRLIDIYGTIAQLRDLAVKTACLARFIDMLPLVDKGGRIRAKEGIEELALADFNISLEGLLNATADHKHATRDIIAALATRFQEVAIRVAVSLNTATRRDDALSWLLEKIISTHEEELNSSFIRQICESFWDQDDAEEAVTKVLEKLSEIASPELIKDIAPR
ncbi:ATP-binding protein [Tunturiibacter gelidiferens]|uniref:ATP-binding protein n=1 Tax=Tunturiibacter gelidiferens TaxID=3069689 RepID=UPI003D9AD498